jgi:fatty acid synthase
MARHYNIVVADNEIRSLTFADLDRLQSSPGRQDIAQTSDEVVSARVVQQTYETDQLRYLQPTENVVELNKMSSNNNNGDAIFVLVPIDGSVELLHNVMSRVHRPVYGLQCTNSIPLTSIPDMASEYIKVMKSISSSGPYNLVGYSFGASVAIEMTLQLQQQHHGDVKSLTLLDGSPATVSTLTRLVAEKPNVDAAYDNTDQSRTEAATVLLFVANVLRLSSDVIVKIVPSSRRKLSWDERVSKTTTSLVDAGIIRTDAVPIVNGALWAFNRKLEMSKKYVPTSRVNRSTRVSLVRATGTVTQYPSLGDDYGVSDIIEGGDIIVNDVIGSHESFITNDDSAVHVANLIDAATLVH